MTTVNEVPLLVASLRDVVANRVRELIAAGNNDSTYLKNPVRISAFDRGAVTEEALKELVDKPIVVNKSYKLCVRAAAFADIRNRSFLLVLLKPHP